MAGIGVKLTKIYKKNTIVSTVTGFGYSTISSIGPMLVVIISILLMQRVLGFDRLGFAKRELFSCTVLYVFIFSLLSVSLFNAVLSKYIADAIYEERFEDIRPCFYIGLFASTLVACLMGIPFCIHEYVAGKVDIWYVFISFCAYIVLAIAFYAMVFLLACKKYMQLSLFFFLGMLEAFVLSFILVRIFHWEVTLSMLFSLATGFFLTSCLESGLLMKYFPENSNHYLPVVKYFIRYWLLLVTNLAYTLGLYIGNFVFWTTDMRMVVADSFVCCQPYDMATCLAMFTNISMLVIFTTRIEMNFHDRYKAYSEAVIGGRGRDITNTKNRMFRQLSNELMNLVRIQFIITVALFLTFVVMLPQLGFSETVMRIYPCLAAGFLIMFVMYASIIFLYYLNDLPGSMMTAVSFLAVNFVVSLYARNFPDILYGAGLVAGSLVGWTVAYWRIRYMEKHWDEHVFCTGTLLRRRNAPRPSDRVYVRGQDAKGINV